MSKNNAVTIIIDGPVATIVPPRPGLVSDLLTTGETTCQAGGPLGYRLVRRHNPLWRHDKAGRLLVLAGLVPRVGDALKARGYLVKINTVTALDDRLVPDRRLLDGTGEDARDYLNAVTGNHRGQVVFGAEWQLVPLMELARRAYPWPGPSLSALPARRSRPSTGGCNNV